MKQSRTGSIPVPGTLLLDSVTVALEALNLPVLVQIEVEQLMKLNEAQQLSPCGVAVWGNFAMRDVVWPVNMPTPYGWIGGGYRPIKGDRIERYRESDLWSPIDDPNWRMKCKQ